jgi:Phage derived protein Gp49-like (DUF891)
VSQSQPWLTEPPRRHRARPWRFTRQGGVGPFVLHATLPRHSIDAMTWGTVETEPEVDSWLDALSAKDFGHVAFYIDMLEAEGAKLHGKLTRPLQGDVHELRFHMGTEDHRISY